MAPIAVSTVRAAAPFAAGKALVVGVISTRVAILIEEVLKTMFLTKLKLASMVLLLIGAAGAVGVLAQPGAGSAASPVANGPQKPASAESRRAPGGDSAPAPLPAQSDVGSPAIVLSRGGPQRTGSVSGSHLPEHPAVQWATRIASSPGEPLLADGVIYVGDAKGNLYAIRSTDGSILWRYAGPGQIGAAPAKRGSTIYFTSSSGLTALSQAEGKVLWHCKHVASATESSPLIVKDRIIVADYSGKVTAVDFDGNRIWQHDIVEDEPPSPPGFDADRARTTGAAARPRTAACDDTAIFQPIFDQSRIAVIDLKRGGRRWSFQAKGWIYGEPTVTDDRVFFGSQDNHLYCLDKRRKTLLWSFPTKSRIEAGVAYRDGSVFFGSCDGRFYRVNAETGKEVWSFRTPESKGARTAIYSAPLCTEDAVYFGSFDGHFYCLKIDHGDMKWRIEPVQESEIASTASTDGRRIVLAVQRSWNGQGQNAIVALGEDEGRKGDMEKK